MDGSAAFVPVSDFNASYFFGPYIFLDIIYFLKFVPNFVAFVSFRCRSYRAQTLTFRSASPHTVNK